MARAVAPTPIPIEDCPMVRTLEIIGEHWTLLVLREAFYGVQRFEDMREHLGVARNILTDRLNSLVEHGVMERIPYQEAGQRTRMEYKLTRKGVALLPTLIAMSQWADKYLPHPKGQAIELRHRETGQRVRLEFVREDGTRLEGLRELEAVYWPDKGR
jgi:DNA-binding HxlR family transcriptional regulator